MHYLKQWSGFRIRKISGIYLNFISFEKMKNIKEQYTVLIHITVPNNVLNLQLFNLFMFEILRTEKLKFSISYFFTWRTGKKGHKGCFNNILHYCVALPSIQTWGRVCIYKYTCVCHIIVLNLLPWVQIVKKGCIQ